MWPFCPRSLGATTAAAPTHRLDEFPAGYSLAGRSPAEPASASPAGYEYAVQSFCRSRIFQRTANSVLTVCVSPGGKRTPLTRRLSQGSLLTSAESDRTVRMARLYAHAVEMIGDQDKAIEWLVTPNRALGGERPLDQLDTDMGARIVEDILGRIAYGVYS